MAEKLASLHKKGGGKRTDSGLLPYSSSTTTKITLGYKPSYVYIRRYKDNTHYAILTYDESISNNLQIVGYSNGTNKSSSTYTITGQTANATIASIDNDGFTVNAFQGAAITTFGEPYYEAVE